jgi:ABC-type glutathione transport system ATPase component
MNLPDQSLLEFRDLEVSYPPPAVRGVSLGLARAEILGLVGESGCGKSSLARAVFGLAPIRSGQVLLEGEPMAGVNKTPEKEQRRRVQLLFQDALSALSPRRTVRQALAEPLTQFSPETGQQREQRIKAALNAVELDPDIAGRYPNQLSGGQRQRVALARAIITGPDVVIADEPVSALDVTVQARILSLLQTLRSNQGIAFLFISHDLAVIRQIADRVAVMRDGVIVESGDTGQVLVEPRHPYTKALLEAVVVPDPTHPRPIAPD